MLFTACACGASKWAREERRRLRERGGETLKCKITLGPRIEFSKNRKKRTVSSKQLQSHGFRLP